MVLWTFVARRDSAAHKKAILIAPAVARLLFVHASFAFLTFVDLFLAFLIIFGLWCRRSLHRMTFVGVPLTICWQLIYPLLARSPGMSYVLAWLQSK